MCRLTDVNGNAAVEVLNSDPEVINVIADYDPEGLLRSIDVDFRGPATPARGSVQARHAAGHDGGHAVAHAEARSAAASIEPTTAKEGQSRPPFAPRGSSSGTARCTSW